MRRSIAFVLGLTLLLLFSTGLIQAKTYEIAAYDLDLQLMDDGRYVITERITYDFLTGAFSKANRHVPGTGFQQLRFLSVEAEGLPVDNVQFRDGRSLSVDWTYPETTGQTTFVVTYEAVGGLRSEAGRNVIDWNPVGSDWEVPIRKVDVTIRLPKGVDGDVSALPTEDVVVGSGADEIRFQRTGLPPRTFYHIVVSFPEIIPVVTEPPTRYGVWATVGLAVALLLLIGDISSYRRDRPEPAESGPAPEGLSLLEIGALLSGADIQQRRGITAAIFSMAQAGHLRLVVEPKRLATDEVRVDVVGEPDLGAGEQLLLDGLRRRKTLRSFARESGLFREVLNVTRQSLAAKGLVSESMRRQQVRTMLTAVPFVFLAFGSFILFAIKEYPAALSLSIVFMGQFVGRLIRGGMMTTLTPEGLHTKQAAEALLDEKLERVDDLMRYEAPRAWDELFEQLPFLTLHPKVTATKLSRWQRSFRRMDQVQAPAWLDVDPGKTGQVMDALNVAQTVNYVFLAVMATAGSTGASGVSGASGAGVGAAGSGAGGGGGGAG